jgi:predicted amidohydrolase YtcJ
LLSKEIPDIPVLLYRVDGHAALANQKALDLAGINTQTVVSGGEIIFENNIPTGILIDNAMDLVKNILPQPGTEEIDRALLLAEKNCFRVGLTTLDDAGMDEQTLNRIIDLQYRHKFKMRMYIMIWATKESLLKYAVSPPFDTLRTHVRAFKFMADGALGSRGACLKHPYSDIHDRKHFGAILNPYEFYLDASKLLYESGWQMNTHCIGDSANKMILQIYAQVLKDINNKRWRIEHAQILDTTDIQFFKKYSIIPSVQPTHATSDMRWVEERVGKDRMTGAYAYKTLLNVCETIALGTDFPVEDINPIKTFYAAVTRKNNHGEPAAGFLPQQALSREEALRGMTIWAAYANFEEHEKGTLEKGKFADFVVLSKDILKCSEKDILNTYVLYTFINGEQVYSFE